MNIENLILENLPYAIWVSDIDGKYIYVNNAYCNDIKLKKDNIIGKTNFQLFNKDIAADFSTTDLITLESHKGQFFIKNHKDRVIQSYKKPLYNGDKFIGILGSFIDITEKYQAEEKLQSHSDLMQTIFDNIPDHIFVKGTDGTYLGCNKAIANEVFACSPKDVVGKTDYDLYKSKTTADEFILQDKEVMASRKKIVNHITIDGINSSKLYMENIKTPLINEKGEVNGVIGISRNISYRKKIEDELFRLSYSDTLTGLYNRTYFIDKINALSKPEFFPLSIVMGDINGLKIINDSLGHLEGDKLLINISNIILSCTKKTDYVFRWGGDEIIILLPNTTEDKANALIDKINKKCASYPTTNIPLSIALGSSTMTSSLQDIDSVLKNAEDKVYRHKLVQNKSFRSSVIDSLQHSLAAKSEETEQHTERLQRYAVKVGAILGLQSWQIDELILVCNLHDIGKIGIPEEILKKPGKLTNEEYQIMKQHAEKGYRIAQSIPELTHISRSILTHHERWDGNGYPLGLKGEEIPLSARIVSVVDSYDAMTNDRCYRKGMTNKEAMTELLKNAGTQFDPTVVDIFVSLI